MKVHRPARNMTETTSDSISQDRSAEPAPLDWNRVVEGIYFAGIGLVGAAWLLRRVRLELVWRSSKPLSNLSKLNVVSAASKVGLPVEPDVRMSQHVGSPCAFGMGRGCVLLPTNCEAWSESTWQLVLVHEFAHLRRKDPLSSAIGGMATALHWPNPFAWLLNHKMRMESERAADDAVLSAGVVPSEYARELIDFSKGIALAGSIPMARRSGLSVRLADVLSPSVDRRGTSPSVNAGFALLMAAVGVFATSVRIQAAPRLLYPVTMAPSNQLPQQVVDMGPDATSMPPGFPPLRIQAIWEAKPNMGPNDIRWDVNGNPVKQNFNLYPYMRGFVNDTTSPGRYLNFCLAYDLPTKPNAVISAASWHSDGAGEPGGSDITAIPINQTTQTVLSTGSLIFKPSQKYADVLVQMVAGPKTVIGTLGSSHFHPYPGGLAALHNRITVSKPDDAAVVTIDQELPAPRGSAQSTVAILDDGTRLNDVATLGNMTGKDVIVVFSGVNHRHIKAIEFLSQKIRGHIFHHVALYPK